ncbi:hypothetical protein N9E64_01295, partial [Candidatus Pelagibacter sp.]|nr:hypothetical protein [Candidatus Pelagibacter sp.]
ILIQNNEKLNSELLKIKSNENLHPQENELKSIKQKLNFHQDENLRLSHELSNSQKKYKLIKDQLEEIEKEKSSISRKIDDLTDSLSKTKIVTNVFDNKNHFNKENSSDNKFNEIDKIDIDKEIKKIFSKS